MIWNNGFFRLVYDGVSTVEFSRFQSCGSDYFARPCAAFDTKSFSFCDIKYFAFHQMSFALVISTSLATSVWIWFSSSTSLSYVSKVTQTSLFHFSFTPRNCEYTSLETGHSTSCLLQFHVTFFPIYCSYNWSANVASTPGHGSSSHILFLPMVMQDRLLCWLSVFSSFPMSSLLLFSFARGLSFYDHALQSSIPIHIKRKRSQETQSFLSCSVIFLSFPSCVVLFIMARGDSKKRDVSSQKDKTETLVNDNLEKRTKTDGNGPTTPTGKTVPAPSETPQTLSDMSEVSILSTEVCLYLMRFIIFHFRFSCASSLLCFFDDFHQILLEKWCCHSRNRGNLPKCATRWKALFYRGLRHEACAC